MELDRGIAALVCVMVVMIFTIEAIGAYYNKKKRIKKAQFKHAKLIRMQWGKKE